MTCRFCSDGVGYSNRRNASPNTVTIKEICGITKLQLERKDSTTMVTLIEAITECWYCYPQIQDTCKKLIDSMPNE